MSGELFQCGYGAIVREDVDVLEACLGQIIDGNKNGEPVRVLEIGMHDGGTARGIERYVKAAALTLLYVGIDPDDGKTRPRHVPELGCVVVGDSAEVFERIGGEFDLVWVDGCHCRSHVVLDTVNYAPMVRPGGFICFHDANPRGQGKCHQYHGPVTPAFGLAIHSGLAAIRFPWPGWELFLERSPEDREDCGTIAFRRSAP